MVVRPDSQDLLRGVLQAVSRSFYLTLRVLPVDVRDQVGLAYLFARAADTIADTELIPRPRRLYFLNRFRDWVSEPARNGDAIKKLQEAILTPRSSLGERILLERLEECGQILGSFSTEDQDRIREVVGILTKGMERDLVVFHGTTEQELVALKTLEELDQYTYYVAGCVGDFWTRLMYAHRPALREWDVEKRAQVGIRFGKGLQLTNVLRDMARDLRSGRCYIPESLLEEAGLKPSDLLDPSMLVTFKPVLKRLLRIALEHLDQGWLYTMAIPQKELRLRLACVWPILFAVKTLQRVSVSADLLDPQVSIKMTRGEVYRDMALSAGTLGCSSALTAYYGHLRKQVAC
jgi:farnesyl-diphosphate farnesyltransferase